MSVPYEIVNMKNISDFNVKDLSAMVARNGYLT